MLFGVIQLITHTHVTILLLLLESKSHFLIACTIKVQNIAIFPLAFASVFKILGFQGSFFQVSLLFLSLVQQRHQHTHNQAWMEFIVRRNS